MPEFSGPDHVALTVTDLDRSEAFYAEVLGLLPIADFGSVRILVQRSTSFVLSLMVHEPKADGRFDERIIGLDHLGLGVATRDELVRWEARLAAHGVTYTPIRDMALGSHLNFRDPDGIALELSTDNEVMAGWFAELREREVPREEIDRRLGEYLASFD